MKKEVFEQYKKVMEEYKKLHDLAGTAMMDVIQDQLDDEQYDELNKYYCFNYVYV